jgi:hypothetical protein
MMRIVILLWMVGGTVLFAQDILDGVRYATTNLTGTARSLALGNAMTAFGPDPGAIAVNPASAGMYRSNYFAISPSLQFIFSSSEFLNETASSPRTNFNISNLSFILFNPIYENYRQRTLKEKGFKSWSLAISYNNIANFHQYISTTGFNDKNSISYFFASATNGIHYADINSQGGSSGNEFVTSYPYAYLGWYAYFIDTVTSSNPTSYVPVVKDGNITQTFKEERRGKNGEWSIAFGGNWSDRVYIGVGLNIRDLNLSYERTYVEEDDKHLHDRYNPALDQYDIQRLTHKERIDVSGTGINGSIGIILQPNDLIRFGLSVKTPTVVSVQDRYVLSSESKWDDGQVFSAEVPEITARYIVTTPFELTAGIAFLIEDFLLLTTDGGINDYTQIRFSGSGTSFNDLNSTITDYLTTSYFGRLGAELRIEQFYLRAGGGYHSPYYSSVGSTYYDMDGKKKQLSTETIFLSGGFGVTFENVFFDLCFFRSINREKFLIYSFDYDRYPNASPAPTLVNKRALNNIAFSIGFRM